MACGFPQGEIRVASDAREAKIWYNTIERSGCHATNSRGGKMTSSDLFFAKELVGMRYRDALRAAERERLLRAAGIHRPGWLAQGRCRLMFRLGRWLVVLGQKLQRRYGVPTLALEEQVT
jgi:hypothetical protein